MTTIRVGIFVFDEVEALDFAGPYEVFTTAARMYKRRHPDADTVFEVCTVGRTLDSVHARAGMEIRPDHSFAGHPHIDLIIVPGGVVTEELGKADVTAWIAQTAARSSITASVCTGAFLLARAGLLAGKSVTTHWEDIDDLRSMFPGLDIKTGVRWVDEGAIVSSAGISAGIDMCLHLVERCVDRELALRTARQLDFDWTENKTKPA